MNENHKNPGLPPGLGNLDKIVFFNEPLLNQFISLVVNAVAQKLKHQTLGFKIIQL